MAEAVGLKVGISAVGKLGAAAISGIGKKILCLLLDNDERDVTNTKVMEAVQSKIDRISRDVELLKLKDLKAACVALKTAIAAYNSHDIAEARQKFIFCEENAVSGYGTCTEIKHKFLATRISIIAVTCRKLLIDNRIDSCSNVSMSSSSAENPLSTPACKCSCSVKNYRSLVEIIMVYLNQFMFEPEFIGHIRTYYQEYSVTNAMKKFLWSGTRYKRLYQTHVFIRELRELVFDNTLHIIPAITVAVEKDISLPYHEILPLESCSMCGIRDKTHMIEDKEKRCYNHLTPSRIGGALKYVTCGIVKKWTREYNVAYEGKLDDQTATVLRGKDAQGQTGFGKVTIWRHIEKSTDFGKTKSYKFSLPPVSLICQDEDFELEYVTSSITSYDEISSSCFPAEAHLKLNNDYNVEPFHQSSSIWKVNVNEREYFQTIDDSDTLLQLNLSGISRRDILSQIQNTGQIDIELSLYENIEVTISITFYFRIKACNCRINSNRTDTNSMLMKMSDRLLGLSS